MNVHNELVLRLIRMERALFNPVQMLLRNNLKQNNRHHLTNVSE